MEIKDFMKITDKPTVRGFVVMKKGNETIFAKENMIVTHGRKFIRETFIDKYKLRELQLIPEQVDNAQQPLVEVQKFDSVDQIVIKQLQGVDSEVYDKNVLTAIYNDLDVQN